METVTERGWIVAQSAGEMLFLSADTLAVIGDALVAVDSTTEYLAVAPRYAGPAGSYLSPDHVYYTALRRSELAASYAQAAEQGLSNIRVRLLSVDESARQAIYARFPEVERYNPNRPTDRLPDFGMRELKEFCPTTSVSCSAAGDGKIEGVILALEPF